MQTDSQLTPEETNTLIRAVVMAGMSVALATPSGSSGTASEFSTIASSFIDQIKKHTSNVVLQSLSNGAAQAEIGKLVQQFHPETMKLQEVKPFAMRRCDELAVLLAAKFTPQDGEEVKQAILAVCRRVAEQSKEGSFLGVGGTRVSPEEEAVIREVARALKTSV